MMSPDFTKFPVARWANAPLPSTTRGWKRWSVGLLSVALTVITGCQDKADEPLQAALSTACSTDARQTVDTFRSEHGQVEYLPEPGLYLLSGGRLSPQRYNRLLDPCNLPEAFRKDGLRVVFSGELKEVYDHEDLAGQPVKLTELRAAE